MAKMSHIAVSVDEDARNTPRPWLKVGASVGKQVNKWADRDDLVVYIGPDAGIKEGAPAFFTPTSAEVHVNSIQAFGGLAPDRVGDFTERSCQFDHLVASGAILHEAMHARHTLWDLAEAGKALPPKVLDHLIILEESRIEANGVKHFPENRSFLRSSALEFVVKDVETDEEEEPQSDTRTAARLLALTLGRVDAGVLDYSDVAKVLDVIRTVLSTETISNFTLIWREFQDLNDKGDEARMYELAHEWERLVQEQMEENGESEEQDGEGGGSGAEGSESGGGMGGLVGALMDALKDAADSTKIGAMDEASDQQTLEEYRDIVSKSARDKEERDSAASASSKVFGGHGHSDAGRTGSTLAEKRKPTSEERIAAVRIAQALDKAKYQDRIRIEAASELPPGRLRTRALVQGEAYKEKGLRIQPEPFQRVQRKHVDDPNLTLGVLVDISGSMGTAMQPMASAAWIFSEAVRRVQGRAAMVYYGSGVFPTLKPGQHLTEVNVYTAPDGTEKFDLAFKAIDGALNLLHGSGARLLVIVSDGVYTSDQETRARHWLKRCNEEGVGVLWVGAGWDGEDAKRYIKKGTNGEFVRMKGSAVDVSMEIGKAATAAITKAGKSRQS